MRTVARRLAFLANGGEPRLAACLLAWLLWRVVASTLSLASAATALDPARIVAAVRLPPEERVERALAPVGIAVRDMLERHTPQRATVYVAAYDGRAAVHRLWARLFSLCFPRVVLPLAPEDAAAVPAQTYVLTPEGEPSAPWMQRARLLEARVRIELWLVER